MTDRKQYFKDYHETAYWSNPDHFRQKSRDNYARNPSAHRERVKRKYKPVPDKIKLTCPGGFISTYRSLAAACREYGLTYIGWKKYPIKYQGFLIEILK